MTDTDTTTEIKKDAQNTGHTWIHRLIEWVEREARILGVDIEVEVTAILAKIRAKLKGPTS